MQALISSESKQKFAQYCFATTLGIFHPIVHPNLFFFHFSFIQSEMVWKHVVLLEFLPEYNDDAKLAAHFQNEVKLRERMPNLVLKWEWAKNVWIPENRARNFQYIVVSYFKSAEDLKIYLTHPEHEKVKAIQGKMVKDKIVMDYEVKDS